jgi:hypothetical protein
MKYCKACKFQRYVIYKLAQCIKYYRKIIMWNTKGNVTNQIYTSMFDEQKLLEEL